MINMDVLWLVDTLFKLTAWTIFTAGIILIVIGVERIYYLYVKSSFLTQNALDQVRDTVIHKNYTEAIQICNSYFKAPEFQVIKSGLLALENGREAIKSSLNSAVLDISRRCESKIPYLALIASSATLLGLLGTIFGLIKTFKGLAAVDAAEKSRLLGEGISDAMLSTAFGLLVGISALIVHTLCTSKTDNIVGRSQDAGFKFITWVEEAERSK